MISPVLFRQWMDFLIRPNAPAPRHLTQSIALEESALPHLLRASVTTIGAFIGVFLLWAALTRVDEVASAQGQVIPSSHVQVAQHLEGGTVKEILVKEGESGGSRTKTHSAR